MSDGLGPEETREYVADLVTQQLQADGFRLDPDQVGAGVGVVWGEGGPRGAVL